MKKLTTAFSIVLLLTVSVNKVSAQYYFYDNKYYDNPLIFEVGGSVGVMNCLTDLGGNKGIGKSSGLSCKSASIVITTWPRAA